MWGEKRRYFVHQTQSKANNYVICFIKCKIIEKRNTQTQKNQSNNNELLTFVHIFENIYKYTHLDQLKDWHLNYKFYHFLVFLEFSLFEQQKKDIMKCKIDISAMSWKRESERENEKEKNETILK